MQTAANARKTPGGMNAFWRSLGCFRNQKGTNTRVPTRSNPSTKRILKNESNSHACSPQATLVISLLRFFGKDSIASLPGLAQEGL